MLNKHSKRNARVRGWLGGCSASVLALATAAALGAGPASAQETGGGGGIETMIVTAQFREQAVQDTPLAITALSAQTLESRSQSNIADVASFAPSTTLQRSEGAFGNAITASIRGIGQGDSDPAVEPGVGIYVDDVYYSQLTGSVLDLLDLERVEVLRGPQGTLAGKNSIGGNVKLFSKKPVGDGSATVQATVGNFARVAGRASGDFAITDTLFNRIAIASEHQRGYVTRKDFTCENPFIQVAGAGSPFVPNPIPANVGSSDCVLGYEGGKSFTAIRDSLRWAPNDNFEITVIGDYTKEDNEGAATTLLQASDEASIPGGPEGMDFLFVLFNPAGVGPLANQSITDGVNTVRYNSRLTPQLLPADRYTSYAGYSMPGGFGTGNNDLAAGDVIPLAQQAAEDRIRTTQWGFSGNAEWRINDNFSIKSISAYRYFKSYWSEDNDVTPLPNSLGVEWMSHTQLSQETRFNGSIFDGAVEFTLGQFYFDQTTTYATHQNLLYSSANFNFFSNGDLVDATTIAGFGHAIWHVTDDLNASFGLRYTEEDKTYTYSRRNAVFPSVGSAIAFVPSLLLPPGPPPVACAVAAFPPPGFDCLGNFNWQVRALDGVGNTAQSNFVDYRAAVDYHFTPDIMAYLQFSTGAKGGGIDPRPFNPAQVLPFGPEKLKSMELGVKSTFFDNRLLVNAATYFSKYDDIQITLNVCTIQAGPGNGIPCALPVNAGAADVYGFELETQIQPIEHLTIDASGSYHHFRYTSLTAGALGSGITFNDMTPGTPHLKWAAGVQYELPIGGWGSLTPRFDAYGQGKIFGNPVNHYQYAIPGDPLRPRQGDLGVVSGYTLMNARLTWSSPDKTLEGAFEVTNLANRFYYLNKFNLLAITGFAAAQPGEPRMYAFTLKKKF